MTSPSPPQTAPWTESEQDYLLSLVPAQVGSWAGWDYVAACMMNQFGPMRIYNGPVVQAQFYGLRDRWQHDQTPPDPYCYPNVAAVNADRGLQQPVLQDISRTSPTVQAVQDEDGTGSKVRIVDRIGTQMEYQFVAEDRLYVHCNNTLSPAVYDVPLPTTSTDNIMLETSAAMNLLSAGVPDPLPDEHVRIPEFGLPDSNVTQTFQHLSTDNSSVPVADPFVFTDCGVDDSGSVIRKNYTKWTPEEEQFLQQVVREHVNDWDRIVQRMHERFPHGRTYTVGSLKKKIQYVPVCRNIPESWFRSDHVMMLPLSQYYGVPPMSGRNNMPEMLRYKLPPETDPSSAIASLSSPPPSVGVFRPEPSRVRIISEAQPSADLSQISGPSAQPAPDPSLPVRSSSRMSEDEIIAAAIVRVVPDLGLLGLDAALILDDPATYWASTEPHPAEDAHADCNVTSVPGTCTDPALSESIGGSVDGGEHLVEGDSLGGDLRPECYDTNICDVTSSPGLENSESDNNSKEKPTNSTDAPTWRRWLQKYTTLKTALGVQ